MPWTNRDATRFTKRAKSAKAKAQWSSVANSLLADGASEASAIRQANAVIKRRGKKGNGK